MGDPVKDAALAKYWRKAYETLVAQTGRDLNDGLGIDPRKKVPSPLARSEGPHPESVEDLRAVLEWLEALHALDMDDIVADGGVTCAMVVQQEAREMAGRLKRARPSPGVSLPVVITDEMVKRASIAFDEYVATIPPNDEVDTEPCVRAALEAALLSRGEG